MSEMHYIIDYEHDDDPTLESYEKFNEVYRNVTLYSNVGTMFLQPFSIVFTALHIFVLAQKELRSHPIFFTMMVIALCDFLGHLGQLYELCVDLKVIEGTNKIYSRKRLNLNEKCPSLFKSYIRFAVLPAITHFLVSCTGTVSVWLTLFMMAFRRMETRGKAIIMVSLLLLGWSIFYGFHFLNQGAMEFDEETQELICTSNSTSPTYITVYPAKTFKYVEWRENNEALTRAVPLIFYAFLWISVYRESRKFDRQRDEIMDFAGIEDDEPGNNKSKLLLVTMSFMVISEGLKNLADLVMFFIHHESTVPDELKIIFSTISLVSRMLVCLNTICHPLVCEKFSLEYRNTWRRVFPTDREEDFMSS